MELEQKVAKLKIVRSNFLTQKYELENCINSAFPLEIQKTKHVINAIETDIKIANSNPVDEEHKFAPMTLAGVNYSAEQKADAAKHYQTLIETEKNITETKVIGSFRGFELCLNYNILKSKQMCRLFTKTSNYTYVFELGDTALGNIQRLINAINSLPNQLERKKAHLKEVEENLAEAKTQAAKPFEHEEEYNEVCKRLAELNKKLALEGANGIENIGIE